MRVTLNHFYALPTPPFLVALRVVPLPELTSLPMYGEGHEIENQLFQSAAYLYSMLSYRQRAFAGAIPPSGRLRAVICTKTYP